MTKGQDCQMVLDPLMLCMESKLSKVIYMSFTLCKSVNVLQEILMSNLTTLSNC